MIIYSVTGVVYDYPKSSCRCFGYRSKFCDAEQAVFDNKGAMDEAWYYQWVVIEEIPEGVWTSSDGKEFWYEWDLENIRR